MFEDLDWKSACRRAAFSALLYLLFGYVMSAAVPGSFGSGTNSVSVLVVAGVFFLIYAPVFAFADRRKRRRLAELKAQKKGKPGARSVGESGTAEDGADDPGDLKGRHNPNTSRKKVARRRRRR